MYIVFYILARALILLLTILVILWARYQWKNCKMLTIARRLPTVVSAWPILGHLPHLNLRHLLDLRGTLSFIHLDLAFKAVQNNIKYHCIWFGPKPYITISNPEDMKVILTKHIEKGEEFDHIKFAVGNGLLTAPGHIWKPIKKTIQPMFQPRNLQYMMSDFNEKSRRLVKQLAEYTGKCDFEIQSEVQRTAAASILKFIYGPEMELFNHAVIERNSVECTIRWFYLWTQRSLSIANRIDFVFKFLYRKKITKLREGTSFILEHATKVLPRKIEQISEQMQTSKTSLDGGERLTFADIFSPLMALEKNVSIMDFYNNVCTVLAAGIETTSFTLASCILTLAINQDVQDKVYEEIINVVGNTSTVVYSHIKLLVYTDQVIKETMRLFPVFPAMTRRLSENTELSFGILPAGAQVNLNVYGVHMDPNIYPDPLKFDPQRFARENVSKRHKFSFLPFGGGPRRCIGADYALLALKTTLAHTIREYRFTTNMKLQDIKFVYNIGLQYKHGCYVSLSKRT